MSIAKEFSFDKEGNVEPTGGRKVLRQYFLTLVILLVAILSFGVGRLTGEGHPGVIINYEDLDTEEILSPTTSTDKTQNNLSVTASSIGSRYYFSYCGNNISEKNKITFATAALAEAAGYTLALNCSPRSR